ncbi:MAG: PAS domain-containing protein [Candidatus Marinimicrobia bacterium]|nr:PAS domain-containing protein [Candidatus Neomarinimicrobiota bacterium]
MSEENTAPRGPGRPVVAGQELLNGLYEAVLLLNVDGQITEANRRAEQFLQAELPDLLGKPISQFVAGLDIALLEQVLNNLADGRFTVLNAFCLRRDHTHFPAEVAISRVTLTGGEGRLVLAVRNIEQRKRTEAALRTFQQAVENAAEAVALTDAKGAIEYVNPAFRALWQLGPEDEAVGRMLPEFWEADEESAAALWQALGAGDSWTGALQLRTPAGRVRHAQATAAINRNEQGEATGLIFSFSDVTALRQALDTIKREANAVIARARQASDFSGPLNIVSIPDLLQLIDGTGKSGWLRILDAADAPVGEIGFREGRIAAARHGDTTGEEAVLNLVREGGVQFAFEQQPAADIPDTGLSLNTVGILLEAARLQDEATAEASQGEERI